MITKNRQHLFSLTKKDFIMQVFRAGGHGGQKQDKTSSAVRIIHPDSGAQGESRRQRSQIQNKKLAFQSLVSSAKFKMWLKIRVAKATQTFNGTEQKIDEMMAPENIKIEHKVDGKWINAKY